MRRSTGYTVVVLTLILMIGYSVFKLSRSRTFQLFGTIVSRVETRNKVVALTFDDGPAQNTQQILDILKQYDVHATFFLTGKEMKDQPELSKAIIGAGHSVGNHSYSHRRMMFMNNQVIEKEVDETDLIIRGAGFNNKIYFRPPYCKKLIYLPWYLCKTKRTTITWDVEPDSESGASPEQILKNVKQNVRQGSIILLHAMYKDRFATLEALPAIIEWLKQNGYAVLTINELVETK